MKIVYPGAIEKLQDAVREANTLLTNPAFYEAVAQKEGFAFSTATGAQVAASMRRCNLTLTVKTYKNPLSRALGYENPHDPTSIFINIAGNKLSRSLGSIAATFIHEAVHAADADDETLEYAHRGNRPAGNEETAPYWIGDLAAQMIDEPEKFDWKAVKLMIHGLEENKMLEENDPHEVTALAGDTVNFRLHVVLYNHDGAPVNIQATIHPRGTQGKDIVYPPQGGSFDWNESLSPGLYLLLLQGTNGPEGRVTATLTGDFYDAPSEPQKTSVDRDYTFNFYFEIA